MPELLSVRQQSFSGGMAPDRGDLVLADDQSNTLMNVSLSTRPGSIEQAKIGTSFFNSVQGAADLTSTIAKTIFRFYKSDGTAQTIVSWVTGIISGISIIEELSETLIDNTIMKPVTDYAVFQDKLYMVNGTSSLLIWDGVTFSTATFATVGLNPFAPKFLEFHNNRAYFAGDLELPSTLLWSEPNDPTNTVALNSTPINDDDGDQIRGIIEQSADLVILKERKVYIIIGSPPQRIEPLEQGNVGTIDQNTIQKTPFGIIFFGHAGLFLLNGRTARIISAPVRQQLKAIIAIVGSEFSSAYHKGLYYLFFRSGSQTAITEGFSWDFNLLDDGNEQVPIVKLTDVQVQNSAIFNGAVDTQQWFACMSGTNNIIRVDASDRLFYQDIANPAVKMNSSILTQWFDMGSTTREKDLREVYIQFHQTIQDLTVAMQIEHLGIITSKSFTISETEALWDDARWDISLWGGDHVFTHRLTMPSGCLCNRVRFFFIVNTDGDRLNLDSIETHYLLKAEV